MCAMKFGGHETFFIRPNWLAKGLALVNENDDLSWASNYASDAIGVGRNMSKSIGWWLNATQLSERRERGAPVRVSPLGKVILENDPYFTDIGTWWFLHLALTYGDHSAGVFSWFFRKNRLTRFRRSELIESLSSSLVEQSEKVPAQKTLQRDVAVLLQSYAKSIPAPATDPEDNSDCPLRRLGLLVFQAELEHYERRVSKVGIPPHAIAAAISLAAHDPSNGRLDVDLDGKGEGRQVARTFNLDSDGLAKMVGRAEHALGSKRLATRFLAGSRVVSIQMKPLEYWAATYFKDIQKPAKQRLLEDVL